MTSRDRELARLLEFTEAAAFADMLRAAPAAWQASDARTPLGWLLLMPTADLLLFNRLIGCGLDAPADPGALRECLQHARTLKLASFGVQLSPHAAPPDVRRWLEQDGFALRDRWTKALRHGHALPAISETPNVTRATPADADEVGRVTCAAFGMPASRAPWIASLVGRPGWSHYLAWHDDAPIAAAAMFVTGEAAWLGVAGTLASARRKGAQHALIARRLADGAALGARWFVTETDEETSARPNPSWRNMRRGGFEAAYQRENFLTARRS